jgi:hypothetical protein
LVGGPDHEAISNLLTFDSSNVILTGPVNDVMPYLRKADIFLYPLSSRHYGTGEQVILEAMATGLPVVAFDNPAEASIINDKETGCLVSSPTEFVNAILAISDTNDYRRRLGTECVDVIKKRYSLKKNREKFDSIFKTVCKSPKVVRTCNFGGRTDSYVDNAWLAYVLGSFKSKDFVQELLDCQDIKKRVALTSFYIEQRILEGDMIWQAATKGSPFHYEAYFPDSYTLGCLTKRLRMIRERG